MKRLEQYRETGGKKLRMGYTTGTCAAGAAAAAARMLLAGGRTALVRVSTPKGIPVELEVEETAVHGDAAACTVRKDAGDDPDVTDGIRIRATVSPIAKGFEVVGGEGVGRVTRPGLSVPPGNAAINPVPREMIRRELQRACEEAGYTGGLRAEIAALGGSEVAKRTFNSRLGIIGGISILGTSGIVEPMSEAAVQESIRLEIRVQRESGGETLLLTPGNMGRDFAREQLGLDLDRGVKCSNYIGEALDDAVAQGYRQILLVGHGGKLVKLAGGVFQTHSRVADCRMEILCAHGGLCGLPPNKLRQMMGCISVDAADAMLCGWKAADDVWSSIGGKISEQLQHRAGVEVQFCLFGARGVLTRSRGFGELAQRLRREQK